MGAEHCWLPFAKFARNEGIQTMQSYIREHTVGGIISGSFRIYFQNFLTFAIAFLLPVLLPNILQSVAIHENIPGLLIVAIPLGLIASLIAVAAMTLLISDLCLGHKPSIIRVYKRVFGTLILKLLWTNVLQMLAVMVGLILLIIPGFVAIAWLMFTSTVVVLERTSGVAALKRSKNLGSTKHWRNIGVLLILAVVGIVFGGLVGGITGAIAPSGINGIGFQIVMTILQSLLMPISMISIVLMYYDLRVRKEAYNLEALSEDLKF